MEGEGSFSRSIIDEVHSSEIQRDQMEGGIVLLEVSLMKFILWISNDVRQKVKVVSLELSLMNFILGISREIKWKVNVVLLEVSLMNFILRI